MYKRQPQDSYYKDGSHVPVEERQNINFEHPDAFDWSLLSKHVMMLKEGNSIEPVSYTHLYIVAGSSGSTEYSVLPVRIGQSFVTIQIRKEFGGDTFP